ncbi:Protein kibra [Nymphon striatum]|nr:Protein kibra [Nymphon striatum]
MPSQNGEIPLPAGWEYAQDYDGKVYFIDHNTKKTTWVDPRDRYMKPQTFSDCVGNELPQGWEESYDQQIGLYYIDHVNELTQLEDPRLQWRSVQENMLREYLVTAEENLYAKKEICDIKLQRLSLAQDEFKHLNNTLTDLGTSHTSLCSSTSNTSTKYDPDLLKADVSLAKRRVSRLKQELEQLKSEVRCKEEGFEKLALVEEKLAGQNEVYNITQAQAIYNELRNIQKSLLCGEKEKAQLLQSLASLRDDLTRSQQAQDLQKWPKLGYSMMNLRKNVHEIQQKLADLEDRVNPGQTESDKDRLLLIQEKEQLLRELRSINVKGRSESEITEIRSEISKLEQDLNVAMEMSNRAIADRLKIHEQKNLLLQQLKDLLRKTTHLESQLRSLSASTLSMSSSSSLGSLSTSSSKGSLSSLSFSDIYGMPQCTVDTGLCDLHRRVEKLLKGSNSSIPNSVLENDAEAPLSSISSPPTSPLDLGPPPSYEHTYNFNKVTDALSDKLSELKTLPIEEKRRHLANICATDSASGGLSMWSSNESGYPPPPLSPIHEHSSSDPALQLNDHQSGTHNSVSAAVSNESVAGDSGVFEASNKRSDKEHLCLSEMNLETAQVQVKLRYCKSDSLLYVGLERARNLSALRISAGNKVCIKVLLLPSVPKTPLGGSTRFSVDLEKPTFGDVLRLQVPINKLCTKTLQINVWSVNEFSDEECLQGCAQLSLAEFEPDSLSTKWYNLLSFHFMKPEAEGLAANNSQANQPLVKESSFPHHSSAAINSKEESSDESTIISSQTSTLTRNQAVPILSDCPPHEEESENSEEIEVPSCQCDTLKCLCDTQDEDEDRTVEICDKETNTECVFLPERGARCQPGSNERAAVIKRSQTFSPSAVVCKSQYNCRLNRSDSDSSMPLYRRGVSFKRNSVERKSLRWKKSPGAPSSSKSHHRSNSTPSQSNKHCSNETRTSIDLELDLQAYQTKLSSLQEDLSRLRELKQRLESVKSNNGESLPHWITENEQILQVLAGVGKEGTPLGAEEKRINKLLKKTSREIYKLRKNRHQVPNAISFKEKIAFFTKARPSLSSILITDSEDGDDETEEVPEQTEKSAASPSPNVTNTSKITTPSISNVTIQKILASTDDLGVEV